MTDIRAEATRDSGQGRVRRAITEVRYEIVTWWANYHHQGYFGRAVTCDGRPVTFYCTRSLEPLNKYPELVPLLDTSNAEQLRGNATIFDKQGQEIT